MTDYSEHQRRKEEFIENERRIRAALIGIIIAVIALVIILIFYREQVWALLTDIFAIVAFGANLTTLIKNGKEL